MPAPVISLKIRNLNQVVAKYQRAPSIVMQEIERALEKSALIIQGDAIKLAPVGATSNLRDSIAVDIRPLEAAVFSTVKYAPFVHEGTRPHFPPIRALRDWARRILGDERLAFPVAKVIGLRGTPNQPFLSAAVRQHERDVDIFFQRALDNISSRLRE